jgi:TonB family protein
MKAQLFLISLLWSSNVLAQTKQITKVNDTLRIIEKYSVLKSNSDIKEGPYEAYSEKYRDKRICTGFYKNNLKDSLWVLFSVMGKPTAMGYYKQGVKTGVWEAKDMRGETEIKYDFTKNQLLDFHYTKLNAAENEFAVIKGSDTTITKLDRPPVFLDGEGFMGSTIALSLNMPESARNSNINGKVLIAVTINSEGKMVDRRVKRSLSFDCDQEAMAAVRRLRGDWLPAILNGKAVSVEYELPISFTNVRE